METISETVFSMNLSGVAGKSINIDWGDATDTDIELLGSDTAIPVTKDYTGIGGSKTITFTGDIGHIYSLDCSNNPILSASDLSYFVNIRTLNFSGCEIPVIEVDNIINFCHALSHIEIISINGNNMSRRSTSDSVVGELLSKNVVINAVELDTVTIAGDSISNEDMNNAWPKYLDNPFYNAADVVNVALGGARTDYISGLLSKTNKLGAPFGHSGVYFIMGGTNDLKQGYSSSHIISQLDNIYSQSKAIYDTVVVFHILPSTGYNEISEAYRQEVNNWITGNPQKYDLLIPVPVELSDPSDTNYYVEGTHPTALGYQILANAVEIAMGW